MNDTKKPHGGKAAGPPGTAASMPGLDWSASHGPITGAISASTACAATALAGTVAGMPSVWPAAVGVAGALGHGVGASVYRRMTPTTLKTRCASWLLAGGWTTWAMATGPLTWTAAGTLAAFGVGVGAMASTAAVHEEAAEEEAATAEARALRAELGAERTAVALEWQDRIRMTSGVAVTVLAVELWPSGAGFSIDAKLPGGKATWEAVASAAKAMAADAGLPHGCTVDVEPGINQGRVVVDVATVNVMADDVDYPTDHSPLSVLTGIPWGLLPNSHPVKVFLRESFALVLGPPGSGKSTFLDCILAGFARCTDVLTWVIDLKAGAAGLPWVRPYLEAQGHLTPVNGQPRPERETRPGIDWLASTPGEAILMLTAALAVNAARQRQYQDLMARDDVTLLPVSARIPQIEIVVDEGAELLEMQPAIGGDDSLKELRGLLMKTMRTTRAMGLRGVLTCVDGNVSSIGDTRIRKFAPVAVALTSGESASDNATKLFPGCRVDTRQLNARGSGVIGAANAEGFRPGPFKGWKSAPSMARAVTLATSSHRPTLDPVSLAAAGEAYARRWDTDRAGWMWKGATATTSTAPTGTPVPGLNLSALRRPAPTADIPGLNLSGLRDRAPRAEDPEVLAERFRRQLDEQLGSTDEPERPGLNLSGLERADTEEPADRVAEPAASLAGPPWVPKAITAIRDAGPAGLKPGAVANAVGVDKRTVAAGLADTLAAGVVIYVPRGPHSSYIHRDHHTLDPT